MLLTLLLQDATIELINQTGGNKKMENKLSVKLYLVDENGISPCFGVDETIELPIDDAPEKLIKGAKDNFAYYLVDNEGFAWSDVAGYDVAKGDMNYEVKATIL
jgi:hypothetical protein